MTIEIKAPTFPESVADGTVANWLKKEGDFVKQDEIIAEIETDKVVLEVVAPEEGTLVKILKVEGDIVLSAEPIGEFDDSAISSPSTEEPKEEKVPSKLEDFLELTNPIGSFFAKSISFFLAFAKSAM